MTLTYSAVLNDNINRRVIESLGLQNTAKNYLIDETATERSERWTSFASGGYPWPDLAPTAWKNENVLPTNITDSLVWHWSDPTNNNMLAAKLSNSVICPVLNNPRQRPEQFISGILGGPPGTRKTSLVKTVSNIFEWPYVPVPASVIFEEGFDRMEAQASKVFRRLNYLHQCVIFFDEFEEFFRDRDADQPSEFSKEDSTASNKENKPCAEIASESQTPIHNRTAAAFTTSAMLPRLQDLHDEKRSLIFLATNSSEKLDSAIKRAGRFDFEETVDYPMLSRFTGEDDSNSYYNNQSCGVRGLASLGITVDENNCIAETNKEKLDDVETIIIAVLKNDIVIKQLIELQAVLQDQGSNTAGNVVVSNLRIKFGLVENVAKYISGKLHLPKENLTKSASELLAKEIQNMINSKGSAGSLPKPGGD